MFAIDGFQLPDVAVATPLHAPLSAPGQKELIWSCGENDEPICKKRRSTEADSQHMSTTLPHNRHIKKL